MSKTFKPTVEAGLILSTVYRECIQHARLQVLVDASCSPRLALRTFLFHLPHWPRGFHHCKDLKLALSMPYQSQEQMKPSEGLYTCCITRRPGRARLVMAGTAGQTVIYPRGLTDPVRVLGLS